MKLIGRLGIRFFLYAGPPALTELQPRGAQKGRPFKLTVAGTNLGEGASIVSTLPATFTPLGSGESPTWRTGRREFLVEPTGDWAVGVYPIRVKAPNGISNILLFSVGAFPEITEDESRPGSLPHQNDSIERAQTIPSTPLTLNGTFKGPERDVYPPACQGWRAPRLRSRSPPLRLEQSIPSFACWTARAKSSRAPRTTRCSVSMPAVAVTFPKEGFYYIEVHDARFSTQVAGLLPSEDRLL